MTAEKDKNRADFPFAASIIDDLRKHFGPGVEITWASENGREVGRKSKNDGVVPVIWTRAPEEKKKGIRGREQ